jgi:hypothetical protein
MREWSLATGAVVPTVGFTRATCPNLRLSLPVTAEDSPTMPDKGRRVQSKDVECLVCGAQPGESCHGSVNGPSRGRSVQSHWMRVEAARSSGCDEDSDA